MLSKRTRQALGYAAIVAVLVVYFIDCRWASLELSAAVAIAGIVVTVRLPERPQRRAHSTRSTTCARVRGGAPFPTMSKTSSARSKTARNLERRRAVPKSNPSRAKVSVALAKVDLAWAEAEAKKRNTTLSAVFGAALQAARRDAAWERCFAAVGGVEDLTAEDRARVDAELRQLGLV